MKNILPKNLKSVFLDFDGVVLESADIKTQAFYDLYLPYSSEIAEKAREYHIRYQGVNRAKKFEAIHKLFLNRECQDSEKLELSKKFSDIVFQKILGCPFVEGVNSFLRKMTADKIPVFLLSATPQEELLTICDKRNLLNSFQGIYGSPHEKSVVGKNIMRECNLGREEAIFVGDSVSDFKAATAMNVLFIGRVPKGEVSPFDLSIPIIESFKDLN